MKSEEFEILLVRELAGCMGEKVRMEFQQIPKNNGIYQEAMVFYSEGSNLMPTVYLEPFRQRYEGGAPIAEIANLIREEYNHACVRQNISVSHFTNWELAGNHIYPKLLNREMNRELLAEVPHRDFLDLSVVFYFQGEVPGFSEGRVLIHGSHLKVWGINEEMLYQRAMQNAPRNKKYIFNSMEEILMGFCEEETEGFSSGLPLYVLTNQEKYLGASVLLYPGVLENVFRKLSRDFYVLPSSIHECIIVPISGNYSRKKLQEMVQEINRAYVRPQDILSDQVYYFSGKEKVLKM